MALTLSGAVSLGMLGARAHADDGDSLWLTSGQSLKNWRSQPDEHKIAASNAAQLAPKWVFTTGGDVSATPAVDEN
jgi:polyvinyl alcohol dehydrogenase (cytochrome)